MRFSFYNTALCSKVDKVPGLKSGKEEHHAKEDGDILNPLPFPPTKLSVELSDNVVVSVKDDLTLVSLRLSGGGATFWSGGWICDAPVSF